MSPGSLASAASHTAELSRLVLLILAIAAIHGDLDEAHHTPLLALLGLAAACGGAVTDGSGSDAGTSDAGANDAARLQSSVAALVAFITMTGCHATSGSA